MNLGDLAAAGVEREEIILTLTRALSEKYGWETAAAFVAIGYGDQPDPLAKRRIMNSATGEYVLTNGDTTLKFTPGYLLAARRVVVNPTRCYLREAGPSLPSPDSKAPPPRARIQT